MLTLVLSADLEFRSPEFTTIYDGMVGHNLEVTVCLYIFHICS